MEKILLGELQQTHGLFREGRHAPGLKLSYKGIFLMCHNVLKAHGAAVIEMRKNAKQEIKIEYAPTCSAHYPATENEKEIETA